MGHTYIKKSPVIQLQFKGNCISRAFISSSGNLTTPIPDLLAELGRRLVVTVLGTHAGTETGT